jgi:hypothetical protein
MHCISWIFGIGALLLVACAVEPGETPPPPSAAASVAEPAAVSVSPEQPATAGSCFTSCLAQCDPNDSTCGETCRCLCFGAEYCP